MRNFYFVFGVVACLLVFDPQMFGQSSAPQPSGEDWDIRTTPYLWGTSINGRVGIGDRTANVDASFGNILNHLHFALMDLTDATWKNMLILSNDVVYSDLRGYRATPGPLFSGVTPNQTLFLLTPEVGFRVLDTHNASVEVLGGVRYWHLKTELDFDPGLLSGIDVQRTRGWVDGIFALRGKAYLPKQWWITGYGDLGGGGSNFTYQLVGTAGVDFHKHLALVMGYRYLNVDYDRNQFLFDTTMKGPLVGFTFKF